MKQVDIFFPLIALVGWTLTVLLLILFHRVRAGLAGRLVADDFRFGESVRVPNDVRIPNRNLINLLEVPLLFYVACLSLHATGHVDPAAVALAWVYVGLRVVHSLIHLSYNDVMHRLAVYAASNVVLLVIWLRLFLGLSA